MDTLLNEFRKQCLAEALDFLWRQWCSLGVAGHAAPAAEGLAIDPEALLLATTSLGRNEPRLFDEALDWLSKFGTLLNLQRLKNLQKSTGLGDEAVLSAVAGFLARHAGQPRWAALTGGKVPTGASEPLFFGTGRVPAKLCDPVFLACGLERGSVVLRGMSRPPNPSVAPNIVLLLRALAGVSARVEVILCLAGGGAANASEIARLTGYAPRTLQALLQEMTLSGRLFSSEPAAGERAPGRRGANRRYQVKSSDWTFLTGGNPLPQWFPSVSLLALVRHAIDSIPALEEKPRHPLVVSSKLREVLVAQGPALSALGLLSLLEHRPEATGAELIKSLATHLPGILAGH